MKSIAEMYAGGNQTATKPAYGKPTTAHPAGKTDWQPWKRPGAPRSIRDVMEAGKATAKPSPEEFTRPRFESISGFFRR